MFDPSRPTTAAPRRNERVDGGQAAVLLVVVSAVLVVVMSLALATFGRATLDRTRAQTAADAAALAGVDGGQPAASRLAAHHGAVVIAWIERGDDVTVTVRLGDATATARATDAP